MDNKKSKKAAPLQSKSLLNFFKTTKSINESMSSQLD